MSKNIATRNDRTSSSTDVGQHGETADDAAPRDRGSPFQIGALRQNEDFRYEYPPANA